jgi:putative NADH-flavin reductase
MPDSNLTVAVTGPTGTFGFGLMPLLQADERIARVVGIARRPFDASEHGWTKVAYRQGDVRDRAALEEAFEGAEVVLHLAFMITGAASRETIRKINVEGTLNAFRAAAAAGARRFVYASSIAAYGFHRDNPVGMTEHWPARPAAHLFYAQEKAEIERLLEKEAAGHAGLGVYLLRPPIVLGPHAVGAKDVVPKPLAPILRRLGGGTLRCGRALRSAVRRMGGSDHSPGDHGREQSQAGTRLALAEDREAPLLGESIHCVLDRGFHFEVDRVDVLAIIDPLWVVVEVNRVEQLGADRRWQRKVRRNGLDRQAEGNAEHDRHPRAAKLSFQPRDAVEAVRDPPALG